MTESRCGLGTGGAAQVDHSQYLHNNLLVTTHRKALKSQIRVGIPVLADIKFTRGSEHDDGTDVSFRKLSLNPSTCVTH